VMANDLLTSYKYGWKTSYYQNTYDFKGDEEEDHQPSGIGTTATAEGEDVELPQTAVDDDAECDACAI